MLFSSGYGDAMSIFLKLLGLFLIITGLSTILIQEFSVEFGTVNYWQNRGVFFLFFVTLFPRLTLLLSSVVSGGFLWWLAWVFSPRILVAYLATVAYWQTNPILVVISWVIALGGETSEKTVVINRGSPIRFKRTVIINGDSYENADGRYNANDRFEESSRAQTSNQSKDTFEADFKVKDEKDV